MGECVIHSNFVLADSCQHMFINVDCHSSSIDTISSALSGYSQLIVNGKIVVRKDNVTGKLNVEGEILITILGKFSRTFDAISPHRLTSTIICLCFIGPLCNDFFSVRSIVKNYFVTI